VNSRQIGGERTSLGKKKERDGVRPLGGCLEKGWEEGERSSPKVNPTWRKLEIFQSGKAKSMKERPDDPTEGWPA